MSPFSSAPQEGEGKKEMGEKGANHKIGQELCEGTYKDPRSMGIVQEMTVFSRNDSSVSCSRTCTKYSSIFFRPVPLVSWYGKIVQTNRRKKTSP